MVDEHNVYLVKADPCLSRGDGVIDDEIQGVPRSDAPALFLANSKLVVKASNPTLREEWTLGWMEVRAALEEQVLVEERSGALG